ncbi:MAG: aminotransferase class III-fold pyridoxal phosphate-dependent enzyme [Patescibacteria group bacterium]
MPDRTKSLYERRMAVGCGPWAETYGGANDNFEVKRYHDGWFVDGQHRGREVKDAIETFNGVLCRIVRPDHSKLIEAEQRAAQTGAEHIGKNNLHEAVVELMENLKAEYDALGIGAGHVLLATTGSSANNMAFRLAHAYTSGGIPFFLERAYHGADYFGNATTNAAGWRGEYPPELPSFSVLDALVKGELATSKHLPYPGNDQNIDTYVKILAERMSTFAPPPILYFEDLQGVGGSFANPGEEFLTQATEITGENSGVVVNDNVQTGMRRGSYLSVPKWLLRKPQSETPIIITLAKAIANGAPLAAVLVPEVIVEDLEKNPKKYGMHWDTFSDNVRTAELGSAVHDIYYEENLGERTPEVRAAIVKQLDGLQGGNGPIADIRGDGLMIGIGLKDPSKLADAIARAPEFGIIIGKGTDALRIAPLADTPLDIAEEAGKRVARLLDSLK